MSKVTVAKVLSKNGKTSKPSSVGEKRVRDAGSGKFVIVRTLDAQSKTFGSDLSYVFTKNVAKARRENKLVTGTSDRVPAKG